MELDVFLNYLKYEKRYSKHTIVAYRRDIKQFFDYLEEQYNLFFWKDVESIYLRSWVVSLMQKEMNASSIQRKISALKTYHKFLLQNKKISFRAFPKVLLPKKAKRLPVYVEEQKMVLLKEQYNFDEGFKGWRDYILLELLYNTGMRRSELINLCWESIEWNKGLISILGKGNKTRLVPFGNELKKTLTAYKKILEKEFPNKENSYILLTDKGKVMYPKFVYNKVRYYLSFVTTNPKRSPHVLRHSFATHLSNNGANLNAIKELLGHTNLATTQVYIHNSIEQLKKIYQQAHPKAKNK